MIIKITIGAIILLISSIVFMVVDSSGAIVLTEVGSVSDKHYSAEYWVEDVYYPESYTIYLNKDGKSFGNTDVDPELYNYVSISDHVEIRYKLGKFSGWTYIVNINPI